MADILLVDCGSSAGTRRLRPLLEGLQVETLAIGQDLRERMNGYETPMPCAVLCVMSGQCRESQSLVKSTLSHVQNQPVIVIDEAFDATSGTVLIAHGVQDYLDAEDLSSERLLQRIEWAILRNGRRMSTLAREAIHATNNDGVDLFEIRQIHAGLPTREREVLDLLLQPLAPKRIARRLGTSAKTVHNQIATLRRKFATASSAELIILVLHAMYQKNDNK